MRARDRDTSSPGGSGCAINEAFVGRAASAGERIETRIEPAR